MDLDSLEGIQSWIVQRMESIPNDVQKRAALPKKMPASYQRHDPDEYEHLNANEREEAQRYDQYRRELLWARELLPDAEVKAIVEAAFTGNLYRCKIGNRPFCYGTTIDQAVSLALQKAEDGTHGWHGEIKEAAT